MLNGVELKASAYDPRKLSRNFYRNVKRCCARLSIPLYVIELETGVSAGYLSRIGNKTKGCDMLLTNALKFSAILNIPVETLVSELNERELIKVLEKATMYRRKKQ